MPTRTKEVKTIVNVVYYGPVSVESEQYPRGDSFMILEEGQLEVYDADFNVIGLYAPGKWIRAAETAIE